MKISLMRMAACLAVLSALTCSVEKGETLQNDTEALTRDQQLVVAAFRLDVDAVKQLIQDGADPNARFGFLDAELFEDKRTLGLSPMGSDRWTPLLAVANSHREPQPATHTENTTEALDLAFQQLKQIDPKIIQERDKRRVAIARLLVANKAALDLDDGYGSTALASAVYLGHDSLALFLLESGAIPNTKRGVYIDGTGDITPLHDAADRPKLVAALLKHGALVNVKNSVGDTPLHVAARRSSVESVRLLVAAGADVKARDDEGLTPMYWVRHERDTSEMAIARLLRNAGAK